MNEDMEYLKGRIAAIEHTMLWAISIHGPLIVNLMIKSVEAISPLTEDAFSRKPLAFRRGVREQFNGLCEALRNEIGDQKRSI